MELFVWTVEEKKKKAFQSLQLHSNQKYTQNIWLGIKNKTAWCSPVLVYSFQTPQPDVRTHKLDMWPFV